MVVDGRWKRIGLDDGGLKEDGRRDGNGGRDSEATGFEPKEGLAWASLGLESVGLPSESQVVRCRFGGGRG